MGFDVEHEKHIHGKAWSEQAKGYFVDPQKSAAYVSAIMRAAHLLPPQAIADLGGGTGFILEQLMRVGLHQATRLFVIDASAAQLSVCTHPRITSITGDFQSFQRSDLVGDAEHLLLISRSVLHYAGKAGQTAWLKQVRRQLRVGEYFVHQSGCADDLATSNAVNRLFELLGADKWIPHLEVMTKLLTECGFQITEDFVAPPAIMISEDLATRYQLTAEAHTTMVSELKDSCHEVPNFLTPTETGFTCSFPFRVFSCKAV